MKYFSVFVYVKFTTNITHDLNGVWKVSMPEVLSIAEAQKSAQLLLRGHLKDRYTLTSNAVSQLLKFGASIHDGSGEYGARSLASYSRPNPIIKISSKIHDEMINDEISLTSVTDNMLLSTLLSRLADPESALNRQRLIKVLEQETDSRHLSFGVEEFNDLLLSANIDVDDLHPQDALSMMGTLMSKIVNDSRLIELTREVALEAGLKSNHQISESPVGISLINSR